MTGDDSRQTQILEEMRDLLKEDLRLRQLAMEEQRGYYAKSQAAIAAAGKKQRMWSILLLVVIALWIGSSYLLPLFFSLLGSGLYHGGRSLSDAVVPSRVETTVFDGNYDLLVGQSLPKMRQRVQAEADPTRRTQGEQILQMQADRFRRFRVWHGVIRSGTVLTQEFSLRNAKAEGTTLSGRALWHEDIHDPGDASEESIILRLNGDVLEFAMLDDQGTPQDSVFLKRVGGH